jgi:hypothetical protein
MIIDSTIKKRQIAPPVLAIALSDRPVENPSTGGGIFLLYGVSWEVKAEVLMIVTILISILLLLAAALTSAIEDQFSTDELDEMGVRLGRS